MNPLHRLIINDLQGGFPLTEQPYKAVADKFGVLEADVIESIRELLSNGLLSRFGPLFDAQQLGGGLTLAALRAEDAQFDQVAGIVNQFPEVAHNYRRRHHLNMWFVVATEDPAAVMETLDSIEEMTGLKVYNFPKIREYYLGLWLHVSEDGSVDTIPVPEHLHRSASERSDHQGLEDLDRQVIRLTQEGLPLEREPYRALAKPAGLHPTDILERLEKMTLSGVIRRIGAIPNHYRLGLRGNGMTVWEVEENLLDECGAIAGSCEFVSHCYHRPAHGSIWPYTLFAMVHGVDRSQVLNKTRRLSRLLNTRVKSHDILFSEAILKKSGLRIAA